MKEGWQFVLNEPAVHFLLALRPRERQQLLSTLDKLAVDQLKMGHYETHDDTGRKIQIMVAGRFLISFWPDAFIKELRVINIEPV